MPVILDTTVGGPTANSYCSLVDALAYNDTHPYGTSWASVAITDDQRSRALITATGLLDQHVAWSVGRGYLLGYNIGGGVASSTQRLLWPRVGVIGKNNYLISSTVIPPEVRDATAEFARQLLATDLTKDSKIESMGIVALKAGPVDVEFKNTTARVIPDAVFFMIRHLGSLVERGCGSVRLVRT